MAKDARVDAYIERQAEFAKPILKTLRQRVHAACPSCDETLKWSMPAFIYKGSILAGMAAFKAHATFGFWQRDGVMDDKSRQNEAMGSFGRITSLEDLPDEAGFGGMVAKAMALIDSGAKMLEDRAGEIRLASDIGVDARVAGHERIIDSFQR